MRNITVSVDEETHRLARIRAAELDTSVSALVRGYLRGLVADRARVAVEAIAPGTEMESQRRRKMLRDVIEDIRVNSPDFKAADNLSREALYDRGGGRAAALAARDGDSGDGGRV